MRALILAALLAAPANQCGSGLTFTYTGAGVGVGYPANCSPPHEFIDQVTASGSTITFRATNTQPPYGVEYGSWTVAGASMSGSFTGRILTLHSEGDTITINGGAATISAPGANLIRQTSNWTSGGGATWVSGSGNRLTIDGNNGPCSVEEHWIQSGAAQ